MIFRIDRIQVELPPPSEPDPAGAAAVQELLGGKFGEMSTFMNYTFQSFNFRNRQGARPFYDLVANIAAEEFGHVELVATTINTMLTGATPTSTPNGRGPGSPLKDVKGIGNPHHFLAGGQGALPQNSQGRPWNGDYVFSSGDLVEDLTHNFFLETGARNNKLKVYEMVEHPAARALTGYLLVRGGVHQVAYARARREAHRREPDEDVPGAAHPDGEDPGVASRTSSAATISGSTGSRRATTSSWRPSSTVRTPRREKSSSSSTRLPRACRRTTSPPQPAVFAPDYAPEEIAEIAAKLRKQAGLPKEPTGEVANGAGRSDTKSKAKAKTTTRRRATARAR